MNLKKIIEKHPYAGIFVRDLNGNEIFAHNANKTYIPASGLKLVTTACLLDSFDKNHTFDTELRYSGEISDDGILHGNIIIKGNWDPSLGSSRNFRNHPPYLSSKNEKIGVPAELRNHSQLTANAKSCFKEFLNAIYAAGIQKIDGSVIPHKGQETKTSVNRNWSKKDLPNYYAAGASELSFNENSFSVFFKSSHPGTFAEITDIQPKIPNLSLKNEVKSGPIESGDNAWFHNYRRSMKYKITGTIPPYSQNFPVKAALFRPANTLATMFYNFLQEQKIIITPLDKSKIKHSQGIIDELSTLIYVHKSPNIDDLLKTMNKFSINLYAENMARAAMGKILPSLKKTLFFQNFFSKINLETENITIDDFCGLSQKNRVTPEFMVDFIYAVYHSPIGQRFLHTLHDYNTPGLKAKTGTMQGIKTLSGILDNQIFSIMINNANVNSSEILALLTN